MSEQLEAKGKKKEAESENMERSATKKNRCPIALAPVQKYLNRVI